MNETLNEHGGARSSTSALNHRLSESPSVQEVQSGCPHHLSFWIQRNRTRGSGRTSGGLTGEVGCALIASLVKHSRVDIERELAVEQVKVVYKRPTDLALKTDVPVVCNLLLADIVDEGTVYQPAHVLCMKPRNAPGAGCLKGDEIAQAPFLCSGSDSTVKKAFSVISESNTSGTTTAL